MLSIKDKTQTKAAEDVEFDQPMVNQKHGVEMLIALNTTNKQLLIGPEVDLDSKILVTKESPNFFFNPTYTLLNDNNSDSTIEIQFQNYLGNKKKLTLADDDQKLRDAIDQLNNGKPRKRRTRKNAN